MKIQSQKAQSRRGFTLVELSIVLVIIGLIIGGVLTGQQIIQNARVTNAINGIQSFGAQFQTYAQNYGAAPGDDSSAKTRFPNGGLPTNVGNGDGTLNGNYDDTSTGTSETVLIWADLRAAGLVKNQLPITAQPPNPFNGIYGFQSGALGGAIPTTALCLNNVPGSAAQAIDTRLDDGAGNTGNMLAIVTGDTTNTLVTSYDSSKVYTICSRI